jgi:hypothetical protein
MAETRATIAAEDTVELCREQAAPVEKNRKLFQ